MRFRGWKHSAPDDGLDPSVAALFNAPALQRRPDEIHLAQARVRVDALLHDALPRGGFARRLGLASLGGSGMWAGFIGAAAAHKAATAAVGIVLLGGTVVETTGVGPAVRTAVHEAIAESRTGEESLAATPTVEAESVELPNTAVPLSEGNPLPGNLVTHLGTDGHFQLRAEIAAADGSLLTLITSDGEFEVDASETEVHATGSPADEIDWADYVDYGVFVTGACADEEAPESLLDCETIEVASVQLLGRAGQGGPPESTGAPEGVGQPEGVGVQGSTQADGSQAPDGSGRPDDPPTGGRPTEGPGAPAE